jgi:2-keto-4-pentenoate hydratase/2-oxohepta-3-ene-1,7-dioic acid hydratase in catechol pathway
LKNQVCILVNYENYYYRHNGTLLPGILTDDGVIGIDSAPVLSDKKNAALPFTNDDLPELKNTFLAGSGSTGKLLNEADLEFGPCIPHPGKIICIGLNYRKHVIENGKAIPSVPVAFTKYNNTLTMYGQDVSLGPVGEQLDYEVELGVVIGKSVSM